MSDNVKTMPIHDVMSRWKPGSQMNRGVDWRPWEVESSDYDL